MKNLEEELLRQLSLINYDRSKILSENEKLLEQKTWTGLGAPDSDQPSQASTAKLIYNGLKKEIDELGTDNDEVLRLIKLLNNDNYYEVLVYVTLYEGKETIMSWIMTDYIRPTERSYEEGEPNLFSQGGLGATFNWWVNDKQVMEMSSILSKFSDLNKDEGDVGYVENREVDLQSDSLRGTATPVEQLEVLSGFLHIALPLTSLAIGIFMPPSWPFLIAAGLIEMADAGVYLLEGNRYAAGLGATFAFVPFGMMKFMPYVYKLGKPGIITLLKKISTPGSKYVDDEIKALEDMLRYESKVTALTTYYMVEKTALYLLRTIKTARGFLNFTAKLIDKLILKPNSLGQIGLFIGGSFVTWDVIAAKLKICNTIPLNALKESDWTILKSVGKVGEYLQPSSSPCDIQKAQELLKKHDNLNIIKGILSSEVNAGTVFDTRYVGAYNIPIWLIQEVLEYGGFYDKLPKASGKFEGSKILLSNADIVKRVEVYNVLGNVKKSYDNTTKSSNVTIDLNGLTTGIYLLYTSTWAGELANEKIVFDGTKILRSYDKFSLFHGKHQSGIYDKQTFLAVWNYQKKKGLTVDGYAGPQTIKSIISDYENKKYGLTKNEIDSWDFNEEKIIEINKEFQKWKENTENQNITEAQVDEAYKTDLANKEKANKVISSAMGKAAEQMNPNDAENLIDWAHDEIENQ